MLYKLEHPNNIVSRMYILEYIRDLGVDTIKSKLAPGEIKNWLYEFSDGENVEYDFIWEYLLFTIPLSSLEKVMTRYLEEINKIEEKRKPQYDAFKKKVEEFKTVYENTARLDPRDFIKR